MANKFFSTSILSLSLLLAVGCAEKFDSAKPWDDHSLRDVVSQNDAIPNQANLETLTNYYPKGEALQNYIFTEETLKPEDDSFSMTLHTQEGKRYFAMKDSEGNLKVGSKSLEDLYSGTWAMRKDRRKKPFILLEFFNGDRAQLTTINGKKNQFTYNEQVLTRTPVPSPEIDGFGFHCKKTIKDISKGIAKLLKLTDEDAAAAGIDVEACKKMCHSSIDQVIASNDDRSVCKTVKKEFRKQFKACK